MKVQPLALTLLLALTWPLQALAQDDEDGASAEDTAASSGTSAADADESDTKGGDDEVFEAEEQPSKPLADRIKAVSRKGFLKRNRFELTPMFGLSVNDAFFRSYLLQVDATYHIIEPFAVELRGAYAIPQPLDPVNFLLEKNETVTGLVKPVFLADVSAVFTPFYGKTALLAEWIWHYDLYLAGGIGVTGIGSLSSENIDNIDALNPQPTMNAGGGLRFFVNDWLLVRVDLRDYLYPAVSEGVSIVQNLLVVSVGASFFFPFTFEHEYDGYKVVS